MPLARRARAHCSSIVFLTHPIPASCVLHVVGTRPEHVFVLHAGHEDVHEFVLAFCAQVFGQLLDMFDQPAELLQNSSVLYMSTQLLYGLESSVSVNSAARRCP